MQNGSRILPQLLRWSVHRGDNPRLAVLHRHDDTKAPLRGNERYARWSNRPYPHCRSLPRSGHKRVHHHDGEPNASSDIHYLPHYSTAVRRQHHIPEGSRRFYRTAWHMGTRGSYCRRRTVRHRWYARRSTARGDRVQAVVRRA